MATVKKSFDFVKSIHFNDIFFHSINSGECYYTKLRAGLSNDQKANYTRYSKQFYEIWNAGGGQSLKNQDQDDEELELETANPV